MSGAGVAAGSGDVSGHNGIEEVSTPLSIYTPPPRLSARVTWVSVAESPGWVLSIANPARRRFQQGRVADECGIHDREVAVDELEVPPPTNSVAAFPETVQPRISASRARQECRRRPRRRSRKGYFPNRRGARADEAPAGTEPDQIPGERARTRVSFPLTVL